MPKQRLDVVASAGVFLFFALMLSVPRGYTLGAVVLLLGGMYYLAQRPPLMLSGEDKLMAWLLAGMSAMGVFSYLYHDNPTRSLDLVSRYVMVVPILLWLIKRPPSAKWVWAGLMVGSISAAGVTLWQVYILDFDRARGTTGVIQFGDLGLIMGVFCAAGFIGLERSGQARDTVWRILLALGAVAGLYASIESGSRGGWIALPAIIAIFVVAYTSRRNVKYVIAAVLILLVAAITAITTVPAVEARYDEAVSDIQRYQAGDPQTSLGYRLDMYKSLSIIIPQKPWLGWSQHDYAVEQERLVSSDIVSDVLFKMPNTHNTFLEFWVLHGLLGLLMLLALLLVAFVYFARRLRADNKRIQTAAVCGTALIVGYSVFSLSQVMLNRNNTLLFFLIAVAVFWAMAKPAATDR
ncbi:hypothetical protein PT7_3159 [Pusillimonas sp. T7-7]|uniref:O-antigen ligase family protein n=1 Tax=Pusillimonas sp. (strain T7-7) TaxID=1007105 RepID=UPI0002084BA6|nr:O-antigen ligase family protein [Pusillimonas sp. T7-7]AEC21699.1 hypothetical protein PT7_3159 [Pusillimonas sp. T7-7]